MSHSNPFYAKGATFESKKNSGQPTPHQKGFLEGLRRNLFPTKPKEKWWFLTCQLVSRASGLFRNHLLATWDLGPPSGLEM